MNVIQQPVGILYNAFGTSVKYYWCITMRRSLIHRCYFKFNGGFEVGFSCSGWHVPELSYMLFCHIFISLLNRLSDKYRVFNGAPSFHVEYLRNGTKCRKLQCAIYRIMQYFQWPWVTPNLDFKVTVGQFVLKFWAKNAKRFWGIVQVGMKKNGVFDQYLAVIRKRYKIRP